MSPLWSAVALGLVLGLQHATDPDHLVAVATIVTRQRGWRAGALAGALWGLGHMLTLTLAGAVVVAVRSPVPPGVGQTLELAVAATLVALGAVRLRRALTGGQRPVVADHDHGGLEALHRHPSAAHERGDRPHLHPARRLSAALEARGLELARTAVAVGAVHGLAGSAGASLLLLATLDAPGAALAYVVALGLGTLGGMTALSVAMAWPVARAIHGERARQALAVAAGCAAIAVGLAWGVRSL